MWLLVSCGASHVASCQEFLNRDGRHLLKDWTAIMCVTICCWQGLEENDDIRLQNLKPWQWPQQYYGTFPVQRMRVAVVNLQVALEKDTVWLISGNASQCPGQAGTGC